jgi:Uma2 family endonuclease
MMSKETVTVEYSVEPPNVEHLVTEDDTPVDNIFSEKQQRLLVDALFSSQHFEARPFIASSNVGIYYSIHKSAVVPDVFLSLDVNYPADIWEKSHRVYMLWELGKPPDVVIEIVSNTVGNEGGRKFDIYAQMGVSYYIVFDPLQFINRQALNIYELRARAYYKKENNFLEQVGLGLTLWQGVFEERNEEWLRWTDAKGNLLQTGLEGIAVRDTKIRQEKRKTAQEKQRAEKFATKLRELGINPEEV